MGQFKPNVHDQFSLLMYMKKVAIFSMTNVFAKKTCMIIFFFFMSNSQTVKPAGNALVSAA